MPSEHSSNHEDQSAAPAAEEQHDRLAQPITVEEPPRLPFPVVGIGGSAGGLEAFIEFFDAMPGDAGMAFVLIQHLAPDRESLIAEILAKHSAMPVHQVENGMAVEPNHVYVIRPGHTLTIKGGHLHLGKSLREPANNHPVDDFFRSLAEEQRERSIAIIMSGMGSNGTAGVESIKAVGGMAVAQEPESAKFPSMPQHLLDSGNADFLLRPAEMPDMLRRYVAHPYVQGLAPAEPTHTGELQALGEILTVLRARTRRDFSGYKKPTVLRRIQRRMGLNQIETLADYAQFLRHNAPEVPALCDDLMIHVTGFFRDPEAWKALAEQVIAPLMAERENNSSIRCWVTACSTGEEAYTLSMLLWEAAEAAGKTLDIKVFATDMADRMLSKARAGAFPLAIESEITPERIQKFFERDDSMYRVKKELRELVVFAPQDVVQDPPFSRLDICTCRNLLIYLEPDLQRRVLSLLHFGLREGGALYLGASETVGGASELFEPIDKRARIFRRVGPTRHGAAEFTYPRTAHIEGPAAAPVRTPSRLSAAQLSERTLLDRYTPAAVTIDRDGRIVHFHGDTTPFLSQPSGEPTRDLLQLARDTVRGAIRIALQEAVAENRVAHHRDGFVETEEGRFRITVSVEPLDAKTAASLYLVTFLKTRELAAPPPAEGGDKREVSDLHDELSRTRDELQSTIEELQSTNEEMRASSEETMSINEELQSTNEELETSKEEMQSLNEELTTVNVQLQLKSDEHEATSNDLASLLSSTQVAVIFLDPKFRIRRFTPAVKDLIELIPTDVGRPLADLNTKFDDPSLLADCQAVIDKLSPVEREVPSSSGNVYMRRVQPYRTVDNRINGVVITFINVTEINQAEERRREIEERFRLVIEGAHDFAMLLLDPRGQIVTASVGAERILGYSPGDLIGKPVAIIFPGDGDGDGAAQAQREMDAAERKGRAQDETWYLRQDGSRLWGSGVLSAVRGADGTLSGFVKVLRDETARKTAEGHRDRLMSSEQSARRDAENSNSVKDQFLARLSHELRTPLSSITTWAEMLQHTKLDEATRLEGMQVIQRSAAAQAQLLNDLLEVSRIASGKLRMEKARTGLSELVRQAVEMMLPAAAQRGVELHVDSECDPCEAQVDADRIRQVVSNLLTNALKFTPSGGRVDVRLERIDDAMELTVSDTGQGIAAEFLPHIFTPFSQGDHSMTRNYGGMGLGMAISKELVERHGGVIEARSEGEGRGATFIVRLPLTDSAELGAAAPPADEAPPSEDALSDVRILLVEDDAATQHAVSRMLERYGADVTAVGSATDAYNAFAAAPDILLSDIGLPNEDGYELLKRIRAQEAERGLEPMPAIALSAFAGAAHRQRALAAGFQEHLAKPARTAELIAVIRRLIPSRV